MDHVPRGLAQEVRIPEDQERLPVFRGHRAALEVAQRGAVRRRHLYGQYVGFLEGGGIDAPEGGERHDDDDHDADKYFCGGRHAESGILDRTSTSCAEAVRRQRCLSHSAAWGA